MNYDITFCSYKKCKNIDCKRHPNWLNGWMFPISMSDFKKCKHWKDGKHEVLGDEK